MSPTPTHGRSSGERGAAAVELALVLPVLLMLVFGIIEFGRGYNTRITLTSAAREGARAMALSHDPDEADAAARAAAAPLSTSQMEVVVPSTCAPGEMVTVTTRYPFE